MYYGYSTGLTPSGDRAFPVIRSRDLVEWEVLGGAMAHLRPAPLHYWAPEVTYADGQFYLYYSCGNETLMQIRVATSRRPDGGFIDSGVCLTDEDFAIDPHLFVDDDGERYLFYATDFLEHTHIGTGIVVDRLSDWYQLEGKPRAVTRARFDWQVYDPKRAEKANARWHTVEGPSVLKRKGKYFQMFSGGNWKNQSYGVGYAVAADLSATDEWTQPIDGLSTLPVLRSTDQVVGPGHNSIAVGPNGRELFCVYHSWVAGERVMSIDRLDIVGDRIVLLGPTIDMQPGPFVPLPLQAGAKISSNFLVSITFRLLNDDGEVRVLAEGLFDLIIRSDGLHTGAVVLSCEADVFEYQKLSVETNNGSARVLLNERLWADLSVSSAANLTQIDLSSTGADVLTQEVTEGFVDLFEDEISSDRSGWLAVDENIDLSIHSGTLVLRRDGNNQPALAIKGSGFDDFEMAANIRSLGENTDRVYGFALLSYDGEVEYQFVIDISGNPRFHVFSDSAGNLEIELPDWYSPHNFHQFRFVKIGGIIGIDIEGFRVARINVSSGPSRIGIVTLEAPTAVEMVRVIRIVH